MMIRPATEQDSEILTEISFSSKNYWHYPAQYFEIWKNELTITCEYIRKNYVQIIETNGEIVGYYSIVELENDLEISNFTMRKGTWLEHVFIRPDFIGKGYGKKLMQHLISSTTKHHWKELKILADPHSTGFYKKLGATYIKDIPSNIPDRTVSYFEWTPEMK
ncbi:GNAT family N-acetyltransferase [uncultured Desulfuromusa sp.]|uniref:GNAT family N-acetyltransferase n=1 Tax=uncultured Desulfuromusa sp. TaxID=219183 RepID=UPI002AA5F7B8|nr:GNAT family N-acetyltransferase [uncultured Desulfuromusa sp.]